jgi:outer membrane protein OmpA-like peptidoglycan-associated protein
LVITGYTDGLGDRAYNINVSQFRADAIKSYFVGRGIGADRITATGLGPANPVAPDDTYHGRSQNRRVEIELVIPFTIFFRREASVPGFPGPPLRPSMGA